MKPRKTMRFEWISLVYLAFFVFAVFSPSIYTRGYLGVPETTLEELTIFLFGVAGLATFTIYERHLERREQERQKVEHDYHRVKQELMDSYAYIGSMNRKIELLKTLAHDTSSSLAETQVPKELFHTLASQACAAAGAQCALLRFVELDSLRTEREFAHDPASKFVFRVANKDLRTVHEQSASHAMLEAQDKRQVLVVPSDHEKSPYKAYLLLHGDQSMDDVDVSLLKVFVNQAEAIYHHFSSNNNKE